MTLITDLGLGQKAKKSDILIIDNAPRGAGRFYARITPQGSRLFYFRYTAPSGKRESFPLGAYDPKGKKGSTLADARSRAGELSRLYQSGIKDIKGHLERLRAAEAARLAAEKRAAEIEASRMTVEELFEQWEELQLSKRKDGKEIRRIFEKDVLPAIGHLPAHAVRKGNILVITDRIEGRGANRLAKIAFTSLRTMFRFAVERDYVEVDPTAAIRKANIGGKDVERERTLSDEEIKLLSKQLPCARLVPSTEAAIWITLSTSCRIGELLRARWEDIDLENRRWVIPAENSKNSRPLELYLSEFTLKMFRILEQERIRNMKFCESEEQQKYAEWLYPARIRKKGNTHLSVKTVTKQIGDRQKQHNKKKRAQNMEVLALQGGRWTMHDLRRTAATVMGDLGIKPEVIDRCLNHIETEKVRRTYQRYSYKPEMKEAWRLLGERLEALSSEQDVARVIPIKAAG